MSRWQYNLLFGLFVVGAVFLMLAKSVFGLEIEPTALTGYGALTTYVLTQRGQWTNKTHGDKPKAPDPGLDASDDEEPS